MAKVVGIGKQAFDSVIENDCFYIDKTSFIKEWWENKDDVTLITRPRRFGKTLNAFSQMSIKTGETCLKVLKYGKMRNIVNYREHIR